MLKYIIIFLLAATPCFASSITPPGSTGNLINNAGNNQFGAVAVGQTITTATISGTPTINGTQPADQIINGSTGAIACSNAAARVISVTGSTAATITIPSASSGGCTQGFSFEIDNNSTATATLTPTGSTCGLASALASSCTIPPNTGCQYRSDGSNYPIFNAGCTALPIATGSLPAATIQRIIGVTIDGAGSTPSTGQKGYFRFNCPGTIQSYSLLADTPGSAIVDIWKANNSIPTIVNTITASALPALSSAQYGQSTTLTGWTTSVAAGDTFGWNLNSASTLTRVTLELYIAVSGGTCD